MADPVVTAEEIGRARATAGNLRKRIRHAEEQAVRPGRILPLLCEAEEVEYIADRLDELAALRTDLAAHARGTSGVPGTYLRPAHGWDCFHCGENFKVWGVARWHFGSKPGSTAACLIKAERGLLPALRDAEDELAKAREEVARFSAREQSLIASWNDAVARKQDDIDLLNRLMAALTSERDEARVRIAELERDEKRLDFLIDNCPSLYIGRPLNQALSENSRVAIDAVMSKEK